MKKLFLIIFTLITYASFSQEYHFTKKCNFEQTRIKPKRVKPENNFVEKLYLSPASANYYMSEDSENFFSIIDTGQMKEINVKKINSETYEGISINNIRDDYQEFEINKILVEKIDENHYWVKTYPRLNAKRTNLEVKFEVQKSEIPFVRLRFMDLSPVIHKKIYEALLEKFGNVNYEFVSADVNYKNGYFFHFFINNCQKQDLFFNLKIME